MEEQHVTQYGALSDPSESHMEKWLVHEAMEVYMYASCAEQETNPRIKAMWERFTRLRAGPPQCRLRMVQAFERRDPAEILGGPLPKMVEFKSQRDFVRRAGRRGQPAHCRPGLCGQGQGAAVLAYRNHLASEGLASDIVSAGYQWAPGGELMRKAS